MENGQKLTLDNVKYICNDYFINMNLSKYPTKAEEIRKKVLDHVSDDNNINE